VSRDALTWAVSQLSRRTEGNRPLLDPAARLVLLALGDRFNEARGYAFPGLDDLAEWTGCDRRTVQRSLIRLEALGLIERRRSEGRGRSTEYRLPLQPKGGTTPPQRGGTTPPHGRQHATSKAAPRRPNQNEREENFPPTPPATLSMRARQVARRAGELHEQAQTDVRRPGAVARWQEARLHQDAPELLEQLAQLPDVELDALARCALERRLPDEVPDPRGRFLPGTGWVAPRSAES
jgi:hypothetical protein